MKCTKKEAINLMQNYLNSTLGFKPQKKDMNEIRFDDVAITLRLGDYEYKVGYKVERRVIPTKVVVDNPATTDYDKE